MSTGLPGLRVDPDDPDSPNAVVYAEGRGTDSDRTQLAHTDISGGDVVEHLHLTTTADEPDEPALIDRLRAGAILGYRYLVLRVTQDFSIRLSRTGPDGR